MISSLVLSMALMGQVRGNTLPNSSGQYYIIPVPVPQMPNPYIPFRPYPIGPQRSTRSYERYKAQREYYRKLNQERGTYGKSKAR